jgi:hypothetical protein
MTLDDLKNDKESIDMIFTHYQGFSQVISYEFNSEGDVVNESGTYESLQSMLLAARCHKTYINTRVVDIYDKYKRVIETHKIGLSNLKQLISECIEELSTEVGNPRIIKEKLYGIEYDKKNISS